MGDDHHRGVEVAGLADGRIDPHPAGGVHLDRLAAGYEAGHVEVMDGHVAEDPARHLDVGDGRRVGVAAGDADQVHVAHITGSHPVAHVAVGGVEAPVESDLHADAGLGGRRDTPVDLGQVERQRLLDEGRLARGGHLDEQVDVGVGRTANSHRVHIAG